MVFKVLFGITLFVAVMLACFLGVSLATDFFRTGFADPSQRPLCHGGAAHPSCVVIVGYEHDPDGGTQLVSNGFAGGVSLPLQMQGSTFDGAMYSWDSSARQVQDKKWSIPKLEGISGGITMITWGTDRDDGIGLAGKITVEQCTGYAPIMRKDDSADVSAGWETGVIFMGNKAEADVTKHTLFPFIHIFKIDLDEDTGKPTRMRLWEALVDDEKKSFLYTEQLKNNIGAETLFGTGAEFASLYTKDKYVPASDANEVFYIEMFFDDTRGLDLPNPSRWVNKSLVQDGLFNGAMPQ